MDISIQDMRQHAGRLTPIVDGALSGDDWLTIFTGIVDPLVPQTLKGAAVHRFFQSMGWFSDASKANAVYAQHKTAIDAYIAEMDAQAVMRFYSAPAGDFLRPYFFGAVLGAGVTAGAYFWQKKRTKNATTGQ